MADTVNCDYFSGYYIYDPGVTATDDSLEEEGNDNAYDSQEVEAMLENSTNVAERKPSWRRGKN